MGTKHTPGPWDILDGSILCQHVNAYGNFHIARFDRCDEPLTDEDRANAKLLAAAPNLLEACKAGLKALNEFYPEFSIHERNAVAMMDAAIGKAEGDA